MERVRFIEHRGIRMLLSDLSGIREVGELQGAVRRGAELASAEPLGSLLILVDLTGVEYSVEAFAIVQQSVAAIRPHVKARAVVGLPSLAAIPFEIVAKLSGAPMARFEGREPALEWLVSRR